MPCTHVVTADRQRARFFRLEKTPVGLEWTLRSLEEIEDLIHPEGGMTDQELFSSGKPGVVFSPARWGTHRQSFDDHRERHRLEAERRFARRVVTRLSGWVHEDGADRILLCAGDRTRGLLRRALKAARLPAEVEEVDADLAGLTPPAVLDRLVAAGALPPAGPRPQL